MLCKKTGNLEFAQSVNFQIRESLKNNGTKYLVFFDESFEEICNSRGFLDTAAAGRHRGLSTIYIKHNFIHRRKLAQDVDLQNTHIVVFKTPRDLM